MRYISGMLQFHEQPSSTIYNASTSLIQFNKTKQKSISNTTSHKCLKATTRKNAHTHCYFCAQTGVVEWTHPTNTDPMAFDVCSDTASCVSVSFTSNRFRAVFAHRPNTIQIFETWRETDWKYSQPSGRDETRSWSGCKQQQNFIPSLQCRFSLDVQVNHTQMNVHRIEKKMKIVRNSSRDKTSIQKLYVVGDSNMKRLFDAFVRLCTKNTKGFKAGKVRENVHVQCGFVHMYYIQSGGADDTSIALQQVVANNQTLVIFNTGHNYHRLDQPEYRALLTRMYNTAKLEKWEKWILVTSPAFATHKWDAKSRCIFNNIRVQMYNNILKDVFPSEHVLDVYYATVQSSDAVDGVHFKSEFYDWVVYRICTKFKTFRVSVQRL